MCLNANPRVSIWIKAILSKVDYIWFRLQQRADTLEENKVPADKWCRLIGNENVASFYDKVSSGAYITLMQFCD